MLFKTRDVRGKERWVNARFVRMVRPGRKGLTEIWISGEGTPVKLDYPADQVAEVVNTALSMTPDDSGTETDAPSGAGPEAGMLLILAG